MSSIETVGLSIALGAAAVLYPLFNANSATERRTTQSFSELSQPAFLSGTKVVGSDRMAFGTCLDEIETTAQSSGVPARIMIDNGRERIVQFRGGDSDAAPVFVTCDLSNSRRIINVATKTFL